MGAWLLPQSYQTSEGADRVGGQLRGDKEFPFSGVTKYGRVWRKVPESDARSVPSKTTLDYRGYGKLSKTSLDYRGYGKLPKTTSDYRGYGKPPKTTLGYWGYGKPSELFAYHLHVLTLNTNRYFFFTFTGMVLVRSRT